MALTGRTALVAALGALLVGLLLPGWTGLLAVELPLLLAILYDLARAAPVNRLLFTRSGDTSVRLGEQVSVSLAVANPSRRILRARIRDAWPPSSWSHDAMPQASRHYVIVPAGNANASPRPSSQLAAATGKRPASRCAPTALLASLPVKATTPCPGPCVSSPFHQPQAPARQAGPPP